MSTSEARRRARRPCARIRVRFARRSPVAPDGRWMIGDWLVDLAANRIERGEEIVALEPRPMAVLAELCRRSNRW